MKSLLHLLLDRLRHIDQPKSVKHPIDIRHATDVSQCLRAINQLSYFFYISKRQQHRAPCQTFTLLPPVNPQFFRVPAIPAFSYLICKLQSGISFEFHTGISQNHSPEVIFCRIGSPPFHRPVSSLPLCTDTNLLFGCSTWKVHTFLIWQVRGNGGFGKVQDISG